MEKLDLVVSRVVEEFEKKPIASSLKGLVLLWALKEIKKWWDKK